MSPVSITKLVLGLLKTETGINKLIKAEHKLSKNNIQVD